ncbi:MAG: hypothetical protein H0V17_17550, partial [Deltaproteobacteria bacterium]|nr:hypothetical protein [Deltaproteobacteria bacterium]
LDAWAAEWWTRVWDAWASSADPVYDDHPLVDAAWEALARGDLQTAIVEQPTGLAHAVLLSLAERRDDALVMAAAALDLELENPDLRHWLVDHLEDLMPSALAVSRDRTRVATIRESRLVVVDRLGGGAATTQYPGRTLRLVRFTRDTDRLWVAGDRFDARGVWGSFIEGVAHDDHGHVDIIGSRAIAALGTGAIVGLHASHVQLASASNREILGELPVHAASMTEDCSIVATHDGVRVSVWHRDPPSCARVAGAGAAVPRRIAIGGGRLLVMWSDGSTRLYPIEA